MENYFQYNHPVKIQWRKGDSEDPYVTVTDTIKIVNASITLHEIPDEQSRVSIEGYYEIHDEEPRDKEFVVDYKNGIVTFNSSQEGLSVKATYVGKGYILYPASRIYLENKDQSNTFGILQDMINESEGVIDQFRDISQVIADGKEASNTISESVVVGNALLENMTQKISEGEQVKSNLIAQTEISQQIQNKLTETNNQANLINTTLTEVILEGQITKEDLDKSILSGGTLKTELDNNITSGTALKTGLDTSIADATTKKSDLDASIAESVIKKAELDASIETGLISKNSINASVEIANTKKTELDTSISNASSQKTSLDESIKNATTIKTELDASAVTAEELKNQLVLNTTDAETVNTTLAGNVETGQNKIQEIDAKIAEAVLATTNATEQAGYAKAQGDYALEQTNVMIEKGTSIVNRGAWNAEVTYKPLNIVVHNLGMYQCLQENTGVEPTETDNAYWQLLIKQPNNLSSISWDLVTEKPDVEAHMADKNNPHNVTASQVNAYDKEEVDTLLNQKADLDSNGKILLQNIPDTAKQQTYVIESEEKRLQLTGLITGDKAFETATGDSYIYDGTEWKLMADADWENVSLEWGNVQNKPTTLSGYGIEDAVSKNGGEITGALTLKDELNFADGSTFTELKSEVQGATKKVEEHSNDKFKHKVAVECIQNGEYSNVEGFQSVAESDYSHAEGQFSLAVHGTVLNVTSFDDNTKTLTLDSVDGVSIGDRVLIYKASSTSMSTETVKITNVNETIITIDTTNTIDSTWKKVIIKNSSPRTCRAEGFFTIASGAGSHAEGYFTHAGGSYSHAEGAQTTTSGDYSHAEGYVTTASGKSSHAEGSNTTASGNCAHAEGIKSTASGDYSHAEGYVTTASGSYSHAEGYYTTASGDHSHTEGLQTIASASYSHAEGARTTASGTASHAEGQETTASGTKSHAEGAQTIASCDQTHAEGYTTEAGGYSAHAEGHRTVALSGMGHAEGYYTLAVNSLSVHTITAFDNTAKTLTLDSVTDLAVGTSILVVQNKDTADFGTVGTYFEGTITALSGNVITVSPKDGVEKTFTSALKYVLRSPITGLAGANPTHAEGRFTIASGSCSHSEGQGTVASGNSSHAEGYNTTASGSYSHAEGSKTTASGTGAHAEGSSTEASGGYSHAEGSGAKASGYASHAEGFYTEASGDYSHAEGYYTKANNQYSHAEGYYSQASGDYSHVEGYKTTASGVASHVEGYGANATGKYSHAEGLKTIAGGDGSHAEGNSTEASGANSHAEGVSTTASGSSSHAEGNGAKATGNYSHAEGYYTTASGYASHTEGNSTTASGYYSHAEGNGAIASGYYSHAGGNYTTASAYASFVMGRYNKALTGSETVYSSTNDAFVIGNGSSTSSLSNAFRVTFSGSVYGKSAFNSSGADYAEYFEWEDGNTESEDRVGYFVTLEGDKIRKATSQDEYIVGVVSVNPSVIGDSCQDDWKGKHLTDEWGRVQYHYVDVEAKYDEEGNEISPAGQEYVPIYSELWNPEEEYIPREKRKEWSPVGMMGKLLVRDDGTCKVNGYCKPNDQGVATESEAGYRVMKRVADNIVLVLIK